MPMIRPENLRSGYIQDDVEDYSIHFFRNVTRSSNRSKTMQRRTAFRL